MAKASTKALKTKSTPKHAVSDEGLARLEKIFEVMGRHQIGELEWEDDQGRIHVRAGGFVGHSHVAHPAPVAAPVAAPAAAIEKTAAPAAAPANQKQIQSPFVGTFYRSPSPTAEAYVSEGKTIKRGDVLCIIEAMKLMNEIESEWNGKIITIHVENGQPVEFGETLFTIET